jgi:hypothetical protein
MLGRAALVIVSACALVRCSLLVDSGGLAGSPGDASGPPSGDSSLADAAPLDASLDVANDTSDASDAGIRGDASVFAQNGHAYLAVATPTAIPWAIAKSAAELRGGHLATITSVEENVFVFGLVRNRPDLFEPGSHLGPWLGGTHTGADATAGWSWVTGETWDYTDWDPGQPDNNGGQEDSLHYFPSTDENQPTWNDSPHGTDYVHGYVIEFE